MTDSGEVHTRKHEKTGKKRKVIHLLTKEILRISKKEKKNRVDYLSNSIVQIQEGWNSKGRKIWKKLNQKSGRHTDGKDEFKHTTWKKVKQNQER